MPNPFEDYLKELQEGFKKLFGKPETQTAVDTDMKTSTIPGAAKYYTSSQAKSVFGVDLPDSNYTLKVTPSTKGYTFSYLTPTSHEVQDSGTILDASGKALQANAADYNQVKTVFGDNAIPQSYITSMRSYASANPQEFLSKIRTAGKTTASINLITKMFPGADQTKIDSIFNTQPAGFNGTPTGAFSDKTVRDTFSNAVAAKDITTPKGFNQNPTEQFKFSPSQEAIETPAQGGYVNPALSNPVGLTPEQRAERQRQLTEQERRKSAVLGESSVARKIIENLWGTVPIATEGTPEYTKQNLVYGLQEAANILPLPVAEVGAKIASPFLTKGIETGVQAGAQAAKTAIKEAAPTIKELVTNEVGAIGKEIPPENMAPSTSVQTGLPGMGKETAQSKMLEEANTAAGQGGVKQNLTEAPKPTGSLEGEQALPESSAKQSVSRSAAKNIRNEDFDLDEFTKALQSLKGKYNTNLDAETELQPQQWYQKAVTAIDEALTHPQDYLPTIKQTNPEFYQELLENAHDAGIVGLIQRKMKPEQLTNIRKIVRAYEYPIGLSNKIKAAYEKGDIQALEELGQTYHEGIASQIEALSEDLFGTYSIKESAPIPEVTVNKPGAASQIMNVDTHVQSKFGKLPQKSGSSKWADKVDEGSAVPQELDAYLATLKPDKLKKELDNIESAIGDLSGDLIETYRYEGITEGQTYETYLDNLLTITQKYRTGLKQAVIPELKQKVFVENPVYLLQNRFEVPVSDVKVDPTRFQFKQNVNASGVTDKLAGAEFNPDLSGITYGWEDKSGQIWIVNGHHRLDLAKRSKATSIRMVIDKEADGVTEQMARAKGALMNIAEDQGTSLDVAKFLKDSGQNIDYLKKFGISPTGRLASRGSALAQLDDSLFQKVINSQLDEDSAVAIGQGLPGDFANQTEVAKLAISKELNPKELAALIKEAKYAGSTKVSQMTLFGETVEEKSLLIARAKLRAYIEDELARDRRLFSYVTSQGRPEALSKGGTMVDVAKGQELANKSATAQTIFDAKVNAVGPINDIINDATTRIVSGGNFNEIKKETLESIRESITTGKPFSASRSIPAGASQQGPGVRLVPEEAKPAAEVKPTLSPASRVSPEDAAKMQAFIDRQQKGIAPETSEAVRSALEKNKQGATQASMNINQPGVSPESATKIYTERPGSLQGNLGIKVPGESITGTATPAQARQGFENILTSPANPPKPAATIEEARSGVAADMQSLYQKLDVDLKGYKTALKGMKGIEAEAARKTIRLLEKEIQNVQNILKTAKAGSMTPQGNLLKKMIATQVWHKGISAKQFAIIKKQLTGKTSLSEMTEPQLQSVLSKLSQSRPVNIGNKEVITAQTENYIQTLSQSLIDQGKITKTTLSEIQHYLNLPTDRYISGRLFISESEGKKLINALNQEAETGLTAWKNKVNTGMLKSPSLKKAYDSLNARIASAYKGQQTGVSSWWDMGKYMAKLGERTHSKLGDLWKRAYDKYLENGVILTNMDKELEETVPNFQQIAYDKEAVQRINDYIASKNKWMAVEYPQNITPDEIKIAQTIEKQLLGFVDDIRYYRFQNAYNKYDGDLNMIAKDIPDAPLMDLNEAVRVYESQGADALSKYLKTRTWGVIESGYEPHMAVNPRLQLNRVKATVVNKNRLSSREGVEYNAGDLNILQRREKYVKQILNLNLEPYFKAMDREFQRIAPQLKDPSGISNDISQAFNELKGYSIGNATTKLIGKLQGYAFSTLALSPHMTFRNAMQNFLHPDLLAFLNPKNRKLTDIEKRFFEAFIDQETGVTKDYLMQGSMGSGRLSRFVQGISYYGKAETAINRLPSYWASLNKAERALKTYRQTSKIEDFIQGSGMNELTLQEQKYILELLPQDSVSYGLDGLQSVPGDQAAIMEIARDLTEKTHFNYIRAGRAPVEQGEAGRTLLSLSTYPRNIATRLYEDSMKIKSGTPADKLRAAKSLTSFIAGALAADFIYEKITGKTQDQYNPIQVLTYTPGGLALGTVQGISAAITDIVDGVSGNETAVNSFSNDITRLGDMFIPFYKSANDLLDAVTDNKNADREAIRTIRSILDKNYNMNPESNDIERSWYQMVQKSLFGGGDNEFPTRPEQLKESWNFQEYNSIPADSLIAQEQGQTRDEYRSENPEMDAKLFVTNQVTSVKTLKAADAAMQLIADNDIDAKDIQSLTDYTERQAKLSEMGITDDNITAMDILAAKLSGNMTPELEYQEKHLALKETWNSYEEAYNLLGDKNSQYYIADEDERAAMRAKIYTKYPDYLAAHYRIQAYSEDIPEDEIDDYVEYHVMKYQYDSIKYGDTYEDNQKESKEKAVFLNQHADFRNEMYRQACLAADSEADESIQNAYIKYFSITGEDQASKREAFRRSNAAFEKWLETYKGYKPLSSSASSSGSFSSKYKTASGSY